VRKFLACLRMNVDLASLVQRRSVFTLKVRFSSIIHPIFFVRILGVDSINTG
jgi:hypothetical protein